MRTKLEENPNISRIYTKTHLLPILHTLYSSVPLSLGKILPHSVLEKPYNVPTGGRNQKLGGETKKRNLLERAGGMERFLFCLAVPASQGLHVSRDGASGQGRPGRCGTGWAELQAWRQGPGSVTVPPSLRCPGSQCPDLQVRSGRQHGTFRAVTARVYLIPHGAGLAHSRYAPPARAEAFEWWTD